MKEAFSREMQERAAITRLVFCGTLEEKRPTSVTIAVVGVFLVTWP